jgi:hypothetical protein
MKASSGYVRSEVTCKQIHNFVPVTMVPFYNPRREVYGLLMLSTLNTVMKLKKAFTLQPVVIFQMLVLMMWIPVRTGDKPNAVAAIRTKTKLPSTVGRKGVSVGRQMTVLEGKRVERREGDKGTNGTKKKGRRELLAKSYLTDHAAVCNITCWMRSVIRIFKATVTFQTFLAVQTTMLQASVTLSLHRQENWTVRLWIFSFSF